MKIKKGDRLILTTHGMKIPVVAASDSQAGHVEIKQNGVFSTVDLKDVELADEDAMHATGVLPEVDDGTPPCPTCRKPGHCLQPKQADAVNRVLLATFECEARHQWQLKFQLP